LIIAGKSVVVTGGANGIGRALAERFAAETARGVTVADIDAGWAHPDPAAPPGRRVVPAQGH
jgi:NAD(P)-dependent dehydrogenase (short-subunit alcohol dehydrogenase family)